MGLCSSVATTFNTPLLLGGPSSVTWCWILGACMCFTLGQSAVLQRIIPIEYVISNPDQQALASQKLSALSRRVEGCTNTFMYGIIYVRLIVLFLSLVTRHLHSCALYDIVQSLDGSLDGLICLVGCKLPFQRILRVTTFCLYCINCNMLIYRRPSCWTCFHRIRSRKHDMGSCGCR